MIRVDPARNQIVEQPPPALRYVWVTATRTQAACLIKFHFDIINTHTDTRAEQIGQLVHS